MSNNPTKSIDFRSLQGKPRKRLLLNYNIVEYSAVSSEKETGKPSRDLGECRFDLDQRSLLTLQSLNVLKIDTELRSGSKREKKSLLRPGSK